MNRLGWKRAKDELDDILSENSTNGTANDMENVHFEAFPNEFARFRALLLGAVASRQQRHEVCQLLKLLTDALRLTGSPAPSKYKALMAAHLLKSSSSTLTDAEMESAKTGLFLKGSFNPSVLRLVLDLILQIRSIVGLKNLHEAAAISWMNVAGCPHLFDDEKEAAEEFLVLPPYEYLSLSDAARQQLSKVESQMKMTASISAQELERHGSNFDYKQAEFLWRSPQKETEEEFGMEASSSQSQPAEDYGGEVNANSFTAKEIISNVEMLFPETGSTIVTHLFELLCSERTDESIQGELIDLLGFEHFEMVGRMLESRGRIVAEFEDAKRIGKRDRAMTATKKEVRREQKRSQKEAARIRNAFGEEDKLEMELILKEAERQRALELEALRWQPSVVANLQPTKKVYPFVFDAASQTNSVSMSVGFESYILPEGTERSNTERFVSFRVPPPKLDSVQDIKHIHVKDMDELGRMGFEGFKKLNTVQSLVFEQAYKTRENLLICAPTGAGKTNIAMLAILNTIHEHRTKSGEIMKNDFKIIYIAPMKALAAEMTENFGRRLSPFGLKVRELTGDTQLTKKQIEETQGGGKFLTEQMLILTPEKWDVVTRKAGDTALANLVRLLIIDEVHLLADSRGSVIETIVARTLRQVLMNQTGIRIVGLSATLPNYIDVAEFLRVNPYKGLFYFDGRFRPVPLTQKFVGVKAPPGTNFMEKKERMDDICYEEALSYVKNGHQVLVFVHSRKATTQLAEYFTQKAAKRGESELLIPDTRKTANFMQMSKSMNSIRNQLLRSLFERGVGAHNAGIIRHDRNLMEAAFAKGYISILFTTATLAWGVNLPAFAVVIRGTDVFDSAEGKMTRLGVLDVQQIFGRAGRPQFENEGHGVILTWESELPFYLRMLASQVPIESTFFHQIHDNLNAEIALGTVSNIKEAVEWLSYTYFMIRAKKNPMEYGMPHDILKKDPLLENRLSAMLHEAAMKLDANGMIRYDSGNGFLSATDLGRIAANFYIKFDTIEMLNAKDSQAVYFTHFMPDDMIIGLISQAQEFKQLKPRDDEIGELDEIVSYGCMVPIRAGGLGSTEGKVNCLLQALISRTRVTSFSLANEVNYIDQNAGRLCRAFFEVALRRGWAHTTATLLSMCKCIERKIWPNQNPLRQLVPDFVRMEWVEKIERRRLTEQQLFELTPKELKNMLSTDGDKAYEAIHMLPRVEVEARLKPITHTIIQVEAAITPAFKWCERLLGKNGSQAFWITLENLQENIIMHSEKIHINKKKTDRVETSFVVFTIPVRDKSLHGNFQLRVASEYWLSGDTQVALSLHNCKLPPQNCAHTDLLPLDPLPITVLNNEKFQSIYSFGYFNPIQTQVFHTMYHTDENVLLGAPTSSGKTCVAEMAIFRLLRVYPDKKCVYIAPMKALVRERVDDWKQKIEKKMGYSVLELSGDKMPEKTALNAAHLLISTPEKWDGITRSWETREYARNVGLVIIDEIHLLGVERGNVLEAIITRLKLLTRRSALRASSARLVGLSTALANAGDVAGWLGIKDSGLFNFRPAVRPVPINVHISGFPGQHYCPRMALMNKPAFKAILSYSPLKPTLVFVASRRQTRLTAMAFISHLVQHGDPKQWLHMEVDELEEYVRQIKDETLKLTLPFGIGVHHAGLAASERVFVEHLFTARKIQVLIATATLAWGINMPAHLVIVKGTEYFDAKTSKYIDFPVTDVLQMMGRAGRPQFDDTAVAVIYVQDTKKEFYKRFLYEPFPVESSLLAALPNHINAEITSQTINDRQGIMEYLAGTYLYRRLFANPNFYGLEDLSEESLTVYLSEIVNEVITQLHESKCIIENQENNLLQATSFGRLASIYYLDHKTIRLLTTVMKQNATIEDALMWLTEVPEYSEVPVRHNEDEINLGLSRLQRIRLAGRDMLSPHTKTHILLQSHFSRAELQSDYRTDLRSVLDQCIRILQAMREVCSLNGWFSSALSVCVLQQMCYSARWWDDQPLTLLPHITEEEANALAPSKTLSQLQAEFRLDKMRSPEQLIEMQKKIVMSRTVLDEKRTTEFLRGITRIPMISVTQCSLESSEYVLAADVNKAKVVTVRRNQSVTLRLHLEANGPNKFSPEAALCMWPKEKSAGWLILVGDKLEDALLGCYPIPPVLGRSRHNLRFITPDRTGGVELSVILMSDCYLGIDQEYVMLLNIQ